MCSGKCLSLRKKTSTWAIKVRHQASNKINRERSLGSKETSQILLTTSQNCKLSHPSLALKMKMKALWCRRNLPQNVSSSVSSRLRTRRREKRKRAFSTSASCQIWTQKKRWSKQATPFCQTLKDRGKSLLTRTCSKLWTRKTMVKSKSMRKSKLWSCLLIETHFWSVITRAKRDLRINFL